MARALEVSPDWLSDGRGYPPEKKQVSENGSVLSAREPILIADNSDRYDPWAQEAIAIIKTLDEAQKRGAIANLKTYVYNLDPPMEQQAPANNERNGTDA